MLKNRNVKMKLLLGFSVVILLFCSAITYTVFFMSGIQSLSADQTRRVQDLKTAQELKNEVALLYGNQSDVMMKQNASAAEQVQKRAESVRSLTDQAASAAVTAEQKQGMEQLKKAVSGYMSTLDGVLDVFNQRTTLSSQEKNDRFMSLNADSEIYKQMIFTSLDRLTQTYEQAYEKSNADLLSRIRNTIAVSVWISAAAVLLAVAFSLLIGTMIGNPLKALAGAARKVAEGDLTGRIGVRSSSDEIGVLAGSFGGMVENLKGLLLEVEAGSKQVAASSQELTSNAEQSTAGSRQVAAAMGEVAAGAQTQGQAALETVRAMEEMAAGVQRIAKSASCIAEVSADTAAKAHAGDEAVQRVVRQMAEIQAAVDRQLQVISRLEMKSEHIGGIVGSILDIAGRTNVLALNAGIEAARSGAQGKGFAVVAAEIRSLAEQSNLSAREIADLIEAIREEIGEASHAMNAGREEVQLGMTRAEETGVSFRHIRAAIDQAADQIQQMSGVAQQMSAGSEEVTASVGALADIAKQTAESSQHVAASTEQQLAIMEQVTASSAHLSELALTMHAAVDKFKM